MKIARIIILTLAVILIAIQFIPSGLPENKPDGEKSITRSGLLAEPVEGMLRESCFDCHSNQVNFPWYAKIAPSSWLLSNHIKEGKENLNFSVWSDYSKRKKLSLLEKIGDEIQSGGMPLKSYLLIHRNAKLNADQKSALVRWTEEATSKILQ